MPFPPKAEKLISVVVPLMNEAACLPRLHAALRGACDALPYRFEFLYVDDGSTDSTVEALASLRLGDLRVRFLVLSRNFGHQAALGAGLAHASGDAVVMMDGDLQHPPELIPELVEQWEAGFEVVNTLRVETAEIPLAKRLWSWAFYRVFNWATSVRIQPGGADFRLMSRVAVNALNALPERRRFLRGLVPWIGFRQTFVAFKAPPRFAGRSKYNFIKNMRFALEGLTSFSCYPLRAMTLLGWMIVASSLIYAAYALGAHLLGGWTVPGWTSLILCVLFFGGAQMTMLGVLGEYLGRTFEQVNGRPSFILREAVGFVESGAGEFSPLPAFSPPHLVPGAPHRLGSAAPRIGRDVDADVR